MGCIGFLIYRLNAVFNVSKTRALVITILSFIAGVALIPIGIALAANPEGGLACIYAWVWSLIYGGIFTFKFCRDMDITIKAEQDLYNPLNQQQLPPAMRPMSNPNSSHLFVPSPIDRP